MYNAKMEHEKVSYIFNNFFINIGKNLAENVGYVLNDDTLNVNKHFFEDSCFTVIFSDV